MNNQVTLIGHVGAAPEIKTFDKGTKVARFSLAVKEMPGTDKEKTLWILIEAWGNAADRVEKAITRGREIVVTGRLSIAEYTSKKNDGSEVQVQRAVVKLDSFHLCGKKPVEGEQAEPAQKPKRTKTAA